MTEPAGMAEAAAVAGPDCALDLVAAMAGADPAVAGDALAAVAGVRVDGGRATWPDEAAWRVAYDAVPPSRRTALHERAAAALAARSGADPAEIARHLRAAGQHAAASAMYVAAGGQASAGRAWGRAREHYTAAVAAARETGEPSALAFAMEELGRERLGSGDVAGARAAFRAAVDAARAADRPESFATAVLGMGSGTGGFEVAYLDREQVDLIREALVLLPADHALRAPLIARLSVALADVEAEDERVALADDAVARARASGDASALGAALAARCDALSGPAYTGARRETYAEVVALAHGDRELELLGRRGLVVALLELGDVAGADAQIRDYAALAKVVDRPLYGWYVPLWRGMRALLEGRIADCRAALAETRAVGGDSHNAYLLASTQRWCLAVETGDVADLGAIGAELAAFDADAPWLGVARTLVAAQVGRTDEARVRLDAVAPHLARLPRDSEWLPTMAQVAEVVHHVGGHDVARETYDALLPWADLLAVEGIGAVVRGSVHGSLGLLAAALGEDRRAAGHFDAALAVHRDIGAPLLVARTWRDRGVALREGAALERAADAYRALGLTARVAEVTETRDGPDGAAVFVSEGDTWTLAYAGRTARVRDAKGLHDIARLLAAPGRPVPVVELAGAAVGSGVGDVVDKPAREAYRRRLAELDEDIADAPDDERAARARAERDALVEQLSAAYGLGGRPRQAGDPRERARTTVTARIKDAIARVEQAHPELGRHLRLSVRTGTFCVYAPEHLVSWLTS